MNTCKDCWYWSGPQCDGLGYCNAGGDLSRDAMIIPEVLCCDCEESEPGFVVGPNFGCIHWKATA